MAFWRARRRVHLRWRSPEQLVRQKRAPIDPLTLCRPLVKYRKRLGISGKLGAAHAAYKGVQRVAGEVRIVWLEKSGI